MVQDCRSDDDIEAISPKIQLSYIRLNRVNGAGGFRADSSSRVVQHDLTEIDQSNVQIRKSFQELQRVIPAATSDIQQCRGMRSRNGGRFGNKIHCDESINSCDLPRFQVRVAVRFSIETLTNFFNS